MSKNAPPTSTAVGNKPGEPACQLRIESPDLKDGKLTFRYRAGTPVTIDLQLTNTTRDKQFFKIKVTENELFKIKPVYGTIAVGEALVAKITFKGEALKDKDGKATVAPNRHFVALFHGKVPAGAAAGLKPKEFWIKGRADGIARLLVAFEETDKE